MISIKGIDKHFGSLHVLRDVDLEITKGEVVVIIGPSGSGKSTLLRCINLLAPPEKGEIIFEGVSLTDEKVDLNIHRQKIGMVFQQFNLFHIKQCFRTLHLHQCF